MLWAALAVLLGLGLLGFVIYQGSNGALQVRKAFLTIPLAIVGGGFVWIRKGIKLAPTLPADEMASEA